MPNSNAQSSLLEGSYQSSSPQQQQLHPDEKNKSSIITQTQSDIVREDRASYTWRVADFGTVPARSRDGSIHATDEVFNAASHLSATLLSILGTVLLITQASEQGNPWKIVSFSLYGASLIFLFLCSTLHHSIIGTPRVELCLRTLDYVAIYPLIAGTFTPLCLVYYHDSSIGWTFSMVVWGLSIMGMVMTSVFFVQIPKWWSMTMYITLGWMGACMTFWLLQVLHWSGFGLFFIGGVFYTVGGFVYTTEQPNPYPKRLDFTKYGTVLSLLELSPIGASCSSTYYPGTQIYEEKQPAESNQHCNNTRFCSESIIQIK
ncbi:UPF0073 inner membrane protein YqfA [Seminavis robusta]|uniref:UPF0073 inner membrane protein YqfA n=1 Tax=Seminavis robusta TaxID=568900 RepID=A0A9N8D889_9STRA|nr:UPF0073 inner membrane protein YqfA [Seminavis robusta]|eukprot:Sro13_g009890.1 UPF0073 inner membrane protein YqfA (317) ;mRNA; r:57270-58220